MKPPRKSVILLARGFLVGTLDDAGFVAKHIVGTLMLAEAAGVAGEAGGAAASSLGRGIRASLWFLWQVLLCATFSRMLIFFVMTLLDIVYFPTRLRSPYYWSDAWRAFFNIVIEDLPVSGIAGRSARGLDGAAFRATRSSRYGRTSRSRAR